MTDPARVPPASVPVRVEFEAMVTLPGPGESVLISGDDWAPVLDVVCSVCGRSAGDGHSHGVGRMLGLLRRIR